MYERLDLVSLNVKHIEYFGPDMVGLNAKGLHVSLLDLPQSYSEVLIAVRNEYLITVGNKYRI